MANIMRRRRRRRRKRSVLSVHVPE